MRVSLQSVLDKRLRTGVQSEPLQDFIPRITPTFQKPTHLKPVTDVFESIARGEAVRALVEVPPRHGKTETLLHGIAWLIARDPAFTVAYASYADAISRSKSRQCRDYSIEAGVQLRNDSASLSEWRTYSGGGLVSTGRGGPLTGFGFKLIVIDDPFKNRLEADSAVIRNQCWDWYTSTARTRLEPGGSIIVCHTRWHPDDLIGRLSQFSSVPNQIVL